MCKYIQAYKYNEAKRDTQNPTAWKRRARKLKGNEERADGRGMTDVVEQNTSKYIFFAPLESQVENCLEKNLPENPKLLGTSKRNRKETPKTQPKSAKAKSAETEGIRNAATAGVWRMSEINWLQLSSNKNKEPISSTICHGRCECNG